MKQFGALIIISAACSIHGQDIDFSNRVVTFTNLEGRGYQKVLLGRADADGVIYRAPEGSGGGRVSYTNLPASLLESLGIPTNRIAIAADRAEKRAKAEAAERERINEQLQRQAIARKLTKFETSIWGKILEVADDGFLVNADGAAVLVSDYPVPKRKGDEIQIGESPEMAFRRRYGLPSDVAKMPPPRGNGTKAYYIGNYKYPAASGTGKTVRRYTCNPTKAWAYIAQQNK